MRTGFGALLLTEIMVRERLAAVPRLLIGKRCDKRLRQSRISVNLS